jgi:DNA repair exonuclease SbcCD ATPase subunit
MSQPYLSIARLERRLATGNVEFLTFEPGVNVLVGRPNTGKTKWLQTFDFLLGDPGENPFEGAEEEGLAEKYTAAAADLIIGKELIRVERRWREPGAKTKIFVDGESMPARDFQQWLTRKLDIPLLSFPKGNPMSGQTWPELSFRMLLRHIYRQQRFWGGIADQQLEGEQHACLLQFLGLAERLFTEDYGQLVKLKMQSEQLKARRDQYGQTLEELARDVLSEPGLTVGISGATVQAAQARLAQEIADLRQRRNDLLLGARDRAVPPEHRSRISELGQRRAETVVKLEEFRRKAKAVAERLDDMRRYRADLVDELDRMSRAEDAGAVLADLKVTHCPACDQSVTVSSVDAHHCFLCHQRLPEEPLVEGLGAVRLRFERDRLTGEFKEADELLGMLQREAEKLAADIVASEDDLRSFENELAPARHAVAALAQDEISAIDMALGEANERQRQIGRISNAFEVGNDLTKRISAIENEIEPLQSRVDELNRSTDFAAAAAQLEDGMNAYLSAIDLLRLDVWRHSPVTVDVSRSGFTMRVGARRWHAALGGTDTLYFLMAYHYGLLMLSDMY